MIVFRSFSARSVRNRMRNRRRDSFGDEFDDDQNTLADCLRVAIPFVIIAALILVIITIVLTYTGDKVDWGVFMRYASIVILVAIIGIVYMYMRKTDPYGDMDQDVRPTREENRPARVVAPAGTTPGVNGPDAGREYVTGGTTRALPTTPPITPNAPPSHHVYANPMSSNDWAPHYDKVAM